MKNLKLLSLFLLGLFIHSCSTDFDINADYKDIAVVYGLLNPADTAQFVKLNKAFLGDVDAYTMAREEDSIYYESAEVFLVPEQAGTILQADRIQLFETTEIDKDSGIFYYETNRLFKTTEALNPNRNYHLWILIPGKDTVSSYTPLISDLSVVSPSTASQVKVSFANQFGYTDFKAEIALNPNGFMYGLTIDFRYREHTANGSVDKRLEWNQVTRNKEFVPGSQYNFLEWNLSGTEFYWFVSQRITPSDEVLFREFLGLDFHFSVAGEDLVSYIETNGPSQGIVQERPFFSNIQNGVGVFSARFNKSISNKAITDFSIDRLACDSLTRELRFLNAAGEVNACN